MMSLLTKIANIVLLPRQRAIERSKKEPIVVQHEQLKRLLKALPRTLYGREIGFTGEGYESFAKNVPVVEYDDISKYTRLALDGEKDILWPGRVSWIAKSSGTTADRSKYIPVTYDALYKGQFRGGQDALAIYMDLNPNTKIFEGKTLTLGGSRSIERGKDGGAFTGDLSAIMIDNAPWISSIIREPRREIALIADFPQKCEAICRELRDVDIRSFSGVPSWNLVLLSQMVEYAGVDNILQVWENMELFIHGGISFVPYRERFEKLIPSPQMHYIETYNASEGFFAVADSFDRDDMLLMLDYGIFYEFLPMSDLDDHTKVVPLEGVKTGVNYAMIISTTSGLWRYMIGDTVEFTSTDPYRIRITGRTSHCINVFGEEVMVSASDRAIDAALRATSAQLVDYTVAPKYMEIGSKGAHQWLVEFSHEPNDINLFAKVLDSTLCAINSDYAAKREGGSTLAAPLVTEVRKGTFMKWMSSRGKVGGQNKIPRLSSKRDYVEQLLKFNI